MRRLLWLLVGALSSTSFSAQSQALAPQMSYRVIDGAAAKRVDGYCAMIWLDDEEVLLIEYRSHTYLMRTGSGNVGRACRVQ